MSKSYADISLEVGCSEVGAGEYRTTFIAAAPERDALAHSLGLVKLTSLVVEIELKRGPARNEIFDLKGRFMASVVRECVVCLGPVTIDIKEDLCAKFVPEARLSVKEDIFVHSDPDHPETYSSDCLELGKLIQDQLSLSIDPYPRHERPSEGDQCIMIAGQGKSSIGLGWFPFRNLGNLLNKKTKKGKD